MIIRPEAGADLDGICSVIEAACGRGNEADLVTALRNKDKIVKSFVADLDHLIIGHIVFCPVTIKTDSKSIEAVGLGPLSILPDYQARGIGSTLVRHGLDELRLAGHRLVVVLGDTEFYPRFGFAPFSRHGVRSEFDAPDDAFMVTELVPGALGALEGKEGVVCYPPEFHIAL